MASITERKNKSGEIISYTIRVYRGYDSSGNRLKPYTMTYKPEPGMTAKQVEKELNRQAVQFEEKCMRGGVADPTIRLSDFCEKYLEIAKGTLSPTTYAFYEEQISSLIIPTLGHFKLKDITAAHVQQYIQQLSEMPKSTRSGVKGSGETISPSTIRRYLTVLQSIFKQAVKLGLIPETPAKTEKLTIPKVKQPKITIERAAVKLKGQKTIIKPPKDYEVRTVTVNQSCLKLMKLLRAEKAKEAARLGTQWINGGWLFTTWNGEIMNPQTPTKQFSKFLERQGLRHRKFHSLRHTSATLLLYAGVNIKQVQGRLGHGDIETTNKYLHVLEEADASLAQSITYCLFNQLNTAPN